MLPSDICFTRIQVNYQIVCTRKLWLFTKNIAMVHSSDLVYEGKLINEDSYDRINKEINIEDIKIDFIKKGFGIVIHEVKKSKKMEKAHIYQLLYYLFYLKNLGVNASGMIDYPLLRKREEVIEMIKQKTVENNIDKWLLKKLLYDYSFNLPLFSFENNKINDILEGNTFKGFFVLKIKNVSELEEFGINNIKDINIDIDMLEIEQFENKI